MTRTAQERCNGTVTPAEFENLPDGEIVDLILCRLEELRRAGCHTADCLVLASRVDVGLEQAADLVARGCPADLALRILL
jgi:hypothetical protein